MVPRIYSRTCRVPRFRSPPYWGRAEGGIMGTPNSVVVLRFSNAVSSSGERKFIAAMLSVARESLSDVAHPPLRINTEERVNPHHFTPGF